MRRPSLDPDAAWELFKSGSEPEATWAGEDLRKWLDKGGGEPLADDFDADLL